jgi:hypothetical protein
MSSRGKTRIGSFTVAEVPEREGSQIFKRLSLLFQIVTTQKREDRTEKVSKGIEKILLLG